MDAASRGVDDLLRGVVGLVEAAFPRRVRAYYLTGSYADATAVEASDLDLTVVFRGRFLAGEAARFRELRVHCQALCPVELGLHPSSEELLPQDDVLHLTTVARLVHGEDVRGGLTVPDVAEYTRLVTRAPARFLAELRGLPRVVFPLAYPDAAGEFYGYDRDGTTKELVLATMWAATCLVALEAGQYVARKGDAPGQYRRHVGDAWTPFVEEVYGRCRTAWRYRIPADAADRRALRDLCGRTLAFENHYLAAYRAYLLAHLRQERDDGRLFAAERLAQVVYPDAEVQSRLRAARPGARDGALGQATERALREIKAVRRSG